MDLRSLFCFRVVLGLTLLVDLLGRMSTLTAHYTDEGVLPTSAFVDLFSRYSLESLHLLSGSFSFQLFLFSLAAVFALCILFGISTKLSCIISWILLSSLQARNPLVLQGGDTLLRLILLFAIFLPLKAFQAKKVLSLSTAAFLLQVCLVYFFSVYFKWNPVWLRGEAVSYALHIESFATKEALFLRDVPFAAPLLTYLTLALEFLGPLFVFSPWKTGVIRTFSVLTMIFLHVCFALFLRIGLFPLVSILGWIPFLPSWFWDGGKTKDLPLETTDSLSQLAAASLFSLVLTWNITTAAPQHLPPLLQQITLVLTAKLGLNQKWNMFSFPYRDGGWPVVSALLSNGKEVDLLRNGEELSWEKPPLVSSLYHNQRWRKYIMNLWSPEFKKHRPYYLDYLCKEWNKTHKEKVTVARFFWVRQTTLPNFQKALPRRTTLATKKLKSNVQ